MSEKTEVTAKEDTVGKATPMENGSIGPGPQVDFGAAIDAMKRGAMVNRKGWNGNGMFAFRQVPSRVPANIVYKMSSLPTIVKKLLVERGGDLEYSCQFALVKLDNTINGWVPSAADVLANDWEIHE